MAAPTLEGNEAAGIHPLRRWIIEHDESWLFTTLYIGLAVVLSIWIGLFWLAAVVGVHFLLEWMRQAHLPPGNGRCAPRCFPWMMRFRSCAQSGQPQQGGG